jgi:hypothetical protein
MARRKQSVADYIASVGAGYLTYQRFVYLGRNASKLTRSHAKLAGLTPIPEKRFRKILDDVQAIQRLQYSGQWHDTVRY